MGYIGELPEGTKKAIYSLILLILVEICKKTNKHRLIKKCLKLVSGDRLVGAKPSVAPQTSKQKPQRRDQTRTKKIKWTSSAASSVEARLGYSAGSWVVRAESAAAAGASASDEGSNGGAAWPLG